MVAFDMLGVSRRTSPDNAPLSIKRCTAGRERGGGRLESHAICVSRHNLAHAVSISFSVMPFHAPFSA